MNQPTDPTPEPVEAAHVRVSPQELSNVVSIIQARKEAEARQVASTIALGDAVAQLGLEMTPEELLAEIRTERLRKSGGVRPLRPRKNQQRTFATFAVCAGLAAMVASSIPMHSFHRQVWEGPGAPFYLPGEFDRGGVPTPSDGPDVEAPAAEVRVMTSASAPEYRPFSTFGPNERADCDFDSLRDLANGKPDADVLVQPSGTNEDRLWTIARQEDGLKVYAYGAPDELARALNGHRSHVFSSEQPGSAEGLLPIRLFRGAEPAAVPGAFGADLAGQNSATENRSAGAATLSVDEGVTLHVDPVPGEPAAPGN